MSMVRFFVCLLCFLYLAAGIYQLMINGQDNFSFVSILDSGFQFSAWFSGASAMVFSFFVHLIKEVEKFREETSKSIYDVGRKVELIENEQEILDSHADHIKEIWFETQGLLTTVERVLNNTNGRNVHYIQGTDFKEVHALVVEKMKQISENIPVLARDKRRNHRLREIIKAYDKAFLTLAEIETRPKVKKALENAAKRWKAAKEQENAA